MHVDDVMHFLARVLPNLNSTNTFTQSFWAILPNIIPAKFSGYVVSARPERRIMATCVFLPDSGSGSGNRYALPLPHATRVCLLSLVKNCNFDESYTIEKIKQALSM